MTKREKIENVRLQQLEEDFNNLLVPVLQECSQGRWGLFGQNDQLSQYYRWEEADKVKEMAKQIIEIRASHGETSPDCERFLYYCSLRGPNVQGEPLLAAKFLKELNAR